MLPAAGQFGNPFMGRLWLESPAVGA